MFLRNFSQNVFAYWVMMGMHLCSIHLPVDAHEESVLRVLHHTVTWIEILSGVHGTRCQRGQRLR